jgi:hypothetical protein
MMRLHEIRFIIAESILPAVENAAKILGGDLKLAIQASESDPYPDKRMTPVIATWLVKKLIIAPDEHEEDIKTFKELRARLKDMNIAHHVSKTQRERIAKLIDFDPTTAKRPSDIQKWNTEVSRLLDPVAGFQSDTGLEVIGKHNGYTMYKIATKDDLKVPLVRNSMSWCVTKKFFGEYGGPPYYAIIRDKDKSPFGMIVPNYLGENPEQAIRNGNNNGPMSDANFEKVRPLIRKVLVPKIHEDPSVVLDMMDKHRMKPGEWPEGERVILKYPSTAFEYAAKHVRGRWPEGEKVIARDPQATSLYAENVLKKGERWAEGEKTILSSKDPRLAVRYAIRNVDGRWSEAEPIIASDPSSAIEYATKHGPWPEAEDTIASNPKTARLYAMNVLGHRFPKGELAISKSPHDALEYAREVVKGRWKEGEEAILTDPQKVLEYADRVLNKRWLKAEDEILKSQNAIAAINYARRVVGGRWPEGESIIATHPFAATVYATKIIGGRWAEGEKAIAGDFAKWRNYTDFLRERGIPVPKSPGEPLSEVIENDNQAQRKPDVMDVLARVIRHPIDVRRRMKLVWLDPEAMDKAWRREKDFHVGPGGSGAAIGNRYERFKEYIAGGEPIYAATASVRPDGKIGFTDGRHRTAVLRDMGAPAIPVSMDAASVRLARKFGMLVPSPLGKNESKGTNMAPLLIEKKGVAYKRANTSVHVSKELADKAIAWARENIDKDDIYVDPEDPSYGIEDDPHVTILYGVDNESFGPICDLCRKWPRVDIKFSGMSVFNGEETGKPYDVIKLGVVGHGIYKLHGALRDGIPNDFKWPEYRPHLTVAYVKAGTGKKYLALKHPLEGEELSFDKFQFTGTDKEKKIVKLRKSGRE